MIVNLLLLGLLTYGCVISAWAAYKRYEDLVCVLFALVAAAAVALGVVVALHG